ncbi:MAG TPA: formate dehydrogenase subunit gamma [Methylomirabilota bacterium]|nr:formate dehydrogenase subunit gamma [Methylomirabilota bacterium]
MMVEGFSAERARAIVAEHAGLEGPLLPILHAVQEAYGHVPEAAVPVIAEELNLTRAEVWGVVTFYHDFRRAPAGRHVVKLCRAEACQSVGAEALISRAERRLGVALGETSADGRVTLEAVYCLGLCATGPAALVDGRPVGRLGPDTVDAIAAEVER